MQIRELTVGIYQTNCYIVSGADNLCVLIDPGSRADTILRHLKEQDLQTEAIFLTHGHFDHVGAVKEIAKETGCRVYLCPKEAALPETFTAGPLHYTHTYGEGDVIAEAGMEFKVLHTPGHTPGSVCLICEDILFTGDTLFAGSCGRTDLPGGDRSAIQSSLRRLAGLEENYLILPGHGEMSDLNTEKVTNPYLK